MNRYGRNWIRPEKRLALYLRDGVACVYCGRSVEAAAPLTLDHLRPVSKGGSNDASNLVTACHDCNSARKKPHRAGDSARRPPPTWTTAARRGRSSGMSGAVPPGRSTPRPRRR